MIQSIFHAKKAQLLNIKAKKNIPRSGYVTDSLLEEKERTSQHPPRYRAMPITEKGEVTTGRMNGFHFKGHYSLCKKVVAISAASKMHSISRKSLHSSDAFHDSHFSRRRLCTAIPYEMGCIRNFWFLSWTTQLWFFPNYHCKNRIIDRCLKKIFLGICKAERASLPPPDKTRFILSALCPSTPHLEKTSLQLSSLEGNPPETTLSENIGQCRSTRQV